jgi:hypothetical protein
MGRQDSPVGEADIAASYFGALLAWLFLIDAVFSKQVRDRNLQTYCQSFDILQSNVASASLNIRYVRAVDSSALSETFLGNIEVVPPFSNGSSESTLNI